MRPDVREALANNLNLVEPHWARFPIQLAGEEYRAMRIERETLGAIDPFRLLAQAGGAGDMGAHTLVLIGVTFPDTGDGFVLLDNSADLPAGDRASGEDLQDHSCAVASR